MGSVVFVSGSRGSRRLLVARGPPQRTFVISMSAAMRRFYKDGSLLQFGTGLVLLMILIVGSRALAQKPKDIQKQKRHQVLDEADDLDAKEMVLTGILVPDARFQAQNKEAKDIQPRRVPKERRAAIQKEASYILWTDGGQRVVLPPVERWKGKKGDYYPYPVINLECYAHGKVLVRVLATEVTNGLHNAIIVKHILDIEQIFSPSESQEEDAAAQPSHAASPVQKAE